MVSLLMILNISISKKLLNLLEKKIHLCMKDLNISSYLGINFDLAFNML